MKPFIWFMPCRITGSTAAEKIIEQPAVTLRDYAILNGCIPDDLFRNVPGLTAQISRLCMAHKGKDVQRISSNVEDMLVLCRENPVLFDALYQKTGIKDQLTVEKENESTPG